MVHKINENISPHNIKRFVFLMETFFCETGTLKFDSLSFFLNNVYICRYSYSLYVRLKTKA